MDLHSLINNLYQQGQGPAGAGGAPASAGAASSSGGSGAASVNVQNFQQLLKKWDEGKANTPVYDPTEVLSEMADILEKETDTYLSKDPDPFEERHPSRVNPDCPFGLILKAFFKKESFVRDVFDNYLRENYFTRNGVNKSSFDLNVAASRIVLDIFPGLQREVLYGTEGLVKRLYGWVQSSPEPLQSYATGLLGVALEMQEVATDSENRERNAQLVPLLLDRLRGFKKEAEMELALKRDSLKRPFGKFGAVEANYTAAPALEKQNSPDNSSANNLLDKPVGWGVVQSPVKEVVHAGHHSLSPCRRQSSESGIHPKGPAMATPNQMTPNGAECSNSSWAEMEQQMIGHFPIHPLTLSAKQIFILRLLTPLGEYQEFLPYIFEQRIQELLMGYINLRETRDARLSFEATRFCCALFCHKKFLLEWVIGGGVRQFIEVPRPSITSTGVAQCLYYMAHDDDTMEKVCLLPPAVLEGLVKYVLWLVECSHESGRQWAVMFFGMACSFRAFLNIFDQQDGVRRLYNSISTLCTLNPDDHTILTDDEEYSQRIALRHVMVTFKQYFQAHLAVKVQQLRRSHQRENGTSSDQTTGVRSLLQFQERSSMLQPMAVIPEYKPVKHTSLQVTEQVECLMELMPFRGRWQPVENFIQLGGVVTCLRVIAIAYDWTFQGRAEMVKSALDVLAIVAVLPKVQIQLCDKIELPDDTKPVGTNVILCAAEGEIVQDSPDVQKSALQVIINCVCAPIERKGGGGSSASGGGTPGGGTPGGPGRVLFGAASNLTNKSKKGSIKTSEDLIIRMWDCVRENNGIMTLLGLLHTKTPITDADSIRALACRALVGLARSPTARQIMSKLQIFTSNKLQQLVREPILLDKRLEHVKFQHYAHELIEMVCGPGGPARKLHRDDDYSLEMLHRASVVAQTKIRFSKRQLLQLIHEYLSSQGLTDAASALVREASLSASFAPSSRLFNCPKSLSVAGGGFGAASTPTLVPPSAKRPRTQASSATPLRSASTSPPPAALSGFFSSTNNVFRTSPGGPGQAHGNGGGQQQIRLNRKRTANLDSSSFGSPLTPSAYASAPFLDRINSAGTPHTPRMMQKSHEPRAGATLSGDLVEIPSESNRITLVSIVSDYLSSQHSLCKNPMVTCPEFDLFTPHKCPDPRPRSAAPTNFAVRLSARMSSAPPYGGPDGLKLNRKLVYSRFKSIKSFRSAELSVNSNYFTSCIFMPDDTYILAGTYSGEVKMFDIQTTLEAASYNCHDSQINNMQVNRDGSLLLTSSPWRVPYSCLWSLGEFFETKIQFPDEDYVEFSKMVQDKVIATHSETATLWDIGRSEVVRTFKAVNGNGYLKNRATLDPNDVLVLNDGVLFDLRMNQEIRKLDKLNQTQNGVFHPNGLEIVSNSEVWDIRTFHLLKTVSGLDDCKVIFTNSGEVIYGVGLEQDTDDGESYSTSFKVFDAVDYSSIATIETKKSVFMLDTSPNDMRVVVAENSHVPHSNPEESVLRIYDVGRVKLEEEDAEDPEDEVEGEDDDEDDDDDDDDDFGLGDDDDDDEDDDDDANYEGSVDGADIAFDEDDDEDDDDDDIGSDVMEITSSSGDSEDDIADLGHGASEEALGPRSAARRARHRLMARSNRTRRPRRPSAAATGSVAADAAASEATVGPASHSSVRFGEAQQSSSSSAVADPPGAPTAPDSVNVAPVPDHEGSSSSWEDMEEEEMVGDVSVDPA